MQGFMVRGIPKQLINEYSFCPVISMPNDTESSDYIELAKISEVLNALFLHTNVRYEAVLNAFRYYSYRIRHSEPTKLIKINDYDRMELVRYAEFLKEIRCLNGIAKNSGKPERVAEVVHYLEFRREDKFTAYAKSEFEVMAIITAIIRYMFGFYDTYQDSDIPVTLDAVVKENYNIERPSDNSIKSFKEQLLLLWNKAHMQYITVDVQKAYKELFGNKEIKDIIGVANTEVYNTIARAASTAYRAAYINRLTVILSDMLLTDEIGEINVIPPYLNIALRNFTLDNIPEWTFDKTSIEKWAKEIRTLLDIEYNKQTDKENPYKEIILSSLCTAKTEKILTDYIGMYACCAEFF